MPATMNKKPQRRPALGGRRQGSVIDVVNEDMMTLAEAAALSCFQTKGKPATAATMHNHRVNGLECAWFPRGWKTSKQAIQRYVEMLNSAEVPVAKKKAGASRHAAATAELDKRRI